MIYSQNSSSTSPSRFVTESGKSGLRGVTLKDRVTLLEKKDDGSDEDLFAGRYRPIKELGRGGMGVVYLMADEEMEDELVAVKTLPEIVTKRADALQQIAREAKNGKSLHHPNIVCVRHYAKWENTPYIVMDYIAGKSLREQLKASGKLPEEKVISLLKPIADALDYAHRATINRPAVLHRDVKPENIIFQQYEDGTLFPVILDFGISKAIESSVDAGAIPKVTIKARTPGYMSPEKMCNSNCDSTVAQDIYAFAVTAYECLTGKLPFGCNEDELTLNRMRNGEFEHLESKSSFARFIEQGLSFDPEKRPKNCLAFFEDIASFTNGEHKGKQSGFAGFAFSLSVDECEWNGKEQRPHVFVQSNGGIREGVDYHVEYDDNIAVGAARAVLVGHSRYRGQFSELPFHIVPRRVAQAKMDKIQPCSYTGSQILPSVRLIDPEIGQAPLECGIDYEVVFFDNVMVGTGTARIRGLGSYGGEMERTFNILPRDIAKDTSFCIHEQEFDGKPCRPEVKVRDERNGRDLAKDVDFSLEFGTDVAKEGWVQIRGKGNYEGTVTKTFKICPRDISKAALAPIEDVRFNGQPLKKITLKLSDAAIGRDLVDGKDYSIRLENADKPGIASVCIIGIGCYGGKIVRQFKILKGIFEIQHGLLSQQFEFDGQKHDLEISVANAPGGMRVEFAKSADGPFATDPIVQRDVCESRQIFFRLQCDGYESYSGIGCLRIVPRSVRDLRIEFPASGKIRVGDWASIKPIVYDPVLRKELKGGCDFELTNICADHVGKGSVDIVGKGNYCDTCKCEIDIEPMSLDTANVDAIPDCVYDAQCQKPKVTLHVAERDGALVEGVDYRVVYGENKNVGEGRVAIIGQGNFNGERVVKFRILPKDIANATFSPFDPVCYAGKTISGIAISATDAELGLALRQGHDFDVECAPIDGVDIVQVKILGKGNYRGASTVELGILPRPISGNTTVGTLDSVTFDGQPVTPLVRVSDCAGQCEEIDELQNNTEGIVLVNAAMAFEVEQYCKKLERGGIRFSLLPMSADQSGVIKVRPDNAAAETTNFTNAFSYGGLSMCYQILVAAEDYERAKELVGQNADEPVPNNEPPPESAFTDPELDPIGAIGQKGIWGGMQKGIADETKQNSTLETQDAQGDGSAGSCNRKTLLRRMGWPFVLVAAPILLLGVAFSIRGFYLDSARGKLAQAEHLYDLKRYDEALEIIRAYNSASADVKREISHLAGHCKLKLKDLADAKIWMQRCGCTTCLSEVDKIENAQKQLPERQHTEKSQPGDGIQTSEDDTQSANARCVVDMSQSSVFADDGASASINGRSNNDISVEYECVLDDDGRKVYEKWVTNAIPLNRKITSATNVCSRGDGKDKNERDENGDALDTRLSKIVLQMMAMANQTTCCVEKADVNTTMHDDTGNEGSAVQTKPLLEESVQQPNNRYVVYTVQAGDYLAKISKRYGVTITAIKKLNPEINGDALHVGQKIKLPGRTTESKTSVTGSETILKQKADDGENAITNSSREVIRKRKPGWAFR